MIVPSIDLMNGRAVQLVGGREKVIDAGDPRPIAERFRLAGEIAVVDLDAALGRGSNADIIHDLIRIASCRVGGGIRNVDAAIRWLDAGATKVILGTAATPEILSEIPRERVVAALDAENGEVVVEGWRTKTGESIINRMKRFEGLVGGFLVTFVEREGRMSGTSLSQVPALVQAAAGARLTIAGGITTAAEIAELDRFGADAQVGMALYADRLDLADAIAAPLHSDRADGLWPTVVSDELGVALGLAYSSAESLRTAVATHSGVYFSRNRGIWTKGASSGNTQELLRIEPDCDRDTLRFTVRQRGPGFCHKNTSTCWGASTGLTGLAERLSRGSPERPGSYTARLIADPQLLAAKLREEAGELAAATTPQDVAHEAADLIYFTLVAMRRAGVPLAAVAAELDRRALKVSRRSGDAKPISGGVV
jgi:phosphoribosyl-AMP cyclohydrolase / phosphoribosyl-ATP pyrophosphohydrolase